MPRELFSPPKNGDGQNSITCNNRWDKKTIFATKHTYMKNLKVSIEERTQEALSLLTHIVSIPAISREETEKADFIEEFLRNKEFAPQRLHNNIWCKSKCWKDQRPTLLLNAHIDTVKPAKGWQHDPFTPSLEGETLYGLGTNDCGGGLVCLMQCFFELHDREDLPYNLIYLASAEEEVSGKNGIESVLPLLPHINAAIVGEPTGMQPAIAEKGLMVLDVTAHGRAGHAARNEGINAIYEALTDIEWFRTHQFERISPMLGPVKMTVTMIQAGSQHNVIPDECKFTVDVRPNECYSNKEVLEEIRRHVKSDVVPRSTRLNSSNIAADHPLVQHAIALGGKPYGSPTLSDQALMHFPSFKLGPGDSARSHTAEEYIKVSEIRHSIAFYINLIEG